MKAWFGVALAVLGVGQVLAQGQPGGYPPQPYPGQPAVQPMPQGQPGYAPAQPDQPVVPQDPRFQRREIAPQQPAPGQPVMPPQPAGPQPGAVPQPQPPFVLQPHEEAQLTRVLQFWEQRSGEVKQFRCKFFRLEYNAFANPAEPDKPQREDKGEIYYTAPDHGRFEVEKPRPECWVCNGKAVYEYDFSQSQVKEYKLPPEQQGKGITDGPLPFIFGAKAVQLRSRYWMRITTPPNTQGQVWLEVYPRFQHDAANFRRVDLILAFDTMLPQALQLHDPGGQSRQVYIFDKVEVNRNNLAGIFSDPFTPRLPQGWKLVPGDVPQTGAAGRPAGR